MGREFYSSWPVRVFQDEGKARSFSDLLNTTYETLRIPIPVDQDVSRLLLDTSVTIVADDRAAREIRERGLDLKAGGLDLTWEAIEVPDGS